MFCERAALEGCRSAITGRFNLQSVKALKARDSQNLIRIENAASDAHSEVEDLHLVLEYSEGETVNGITAPRDNRFYIVRDFKGKTLETFETYRGSLATRTDFRKHIFGRATVSPTWPWARRAAATAAGCASTPARTAR